MRTHNHFSQALHCKSPEIFQITELMGVKFEKIGGLEKCVLDKKRVVHLTFCVFVTNRQTELLHVTKGNLFERFLAFF